MSRKTLMKIHLYIAAFFTPMLLIMAVSGGLYLAGFEGEMKKGEPVLIPGAALIQEGDAKADELRAILEQAGLDSNFAYIRERGAMMQSRSTSRDFYEVKTLPAGLEITPVSPDLVAALMELHKGHGPRIFRTMEIVLSVGLVLILLTGLILGIQSPLFKIRTVAITGTGIFVAVILAALF